MSETKESTKMMERILEELVFMRSKLPNGDLKSIQTSIDDLKHSQDSIKSDVSELKKKLLDPEAGVVVKLNQNTQYIQDKKEMEDYYDEIIDQHRDLLSSFKKILLLHFIIKDELYFLLCQELYCFR